MQLTGLPPSTAGSSATPTLSFTALSALWNRFQPYDHNTANTALPDSKSLRVWSVTISATLRGATPSFTSPVHNANDFSAASRSHVRCPSCTSVLPMLQYGSRNVQTVPSIGAPWKLTP